ncbi:hypothetical protein ACP70R_047091 [Stipagrostis hirtigluma subsp. patula]
MAVGGLLHLWNELGVQVMVLVSFALQVFLLVYGGIRRRNSSAVLRIVLWLAYLSADSTAIYTLGHLSVVSRSREHQLVAFWAPFLLLHLGGPDSITAYALEDNRLWLRHLQTLTVQSVAAAYVVYKYMAGSGALLLLASISMFVAGLVKYGERTWALKCGNMDSIANRVDRSEKSFESLIQHTRDEEEMLLAAHSHFDVCKGFFTDVTMTGDSTRNLYQLLEMELSLMYDILYTKAAVIHTWYGLCIHFLSLLGVAVAFLLFQLSINSTGDGYSKVDVVISYVLLAGALVVEAISWCRALLSTWTSCTFMGRRGRGWEWLLHVVTSLRRRVQPARRRLWSGSIGQYNLLHRCTSDRNGIRSRMAKKLGLEDRWNKMCFSTTFSGSEFCSVEDLKMLVLGAMATIGTGMNSRGSATLGRNQCEVNKWSVDMDLDKSILVWHIVTDLVIRFPRGGGKVNKMLVEATKVLSNYMMFLLVAKPDMLPGRMRREVYLNACKELDREWTRCLDKWSPLEEVESRPREDVLADWLLADLYHSLLKNPDCPSEIFIERYDRENIIRGLIRWSPRFSLLTILAKGRKEEEAPEHAKDVYNAIWIYESIWSTPRGKDTWLEMIFHMWVEMMVYVAEHCSRDSHARHLSHGGEFITITWLMARHIKYYSIPDDAIPNYGSITGGFA